MFLCLRNKKTFPSSTYNIIVETISVNWSASPYVLYSEWEKDVEQHYTPLWPCCANRCFSDSCSIGQVEAIQAPFLFRCPSGGLLSPLKPTWVPTKILEQKNQNEDA